MLEISHTMNRRLAAITPVDHPGGAETTLLRLLGGLAQRGWRITLTTPGDGPLREAARRAGFAWRRLPLGGLERGAGARATLGWERALRLGRSHDVLYLNGTVCGRLLPALPRPLRRARVVLHVHDIVERVPPFWRLADAVLADSAAVAERLERLHPYVVYCPVDADPPPATPPWPLGEGPLIGFVGRLEPRKAPLDLVRAAPLIRERLPAARIVLIGDEPYGLAPDYTRSVRESAGVELFGWQENAPGLMRHLDVLVLPSRQEPFGTVLAEAMAVGTPVVATRVGGLAEVVLDGVTGRLVEPGDIAALAGAVVEVVARRAKMGAAARLHAERFHTDAYVARVEALIAP